MTIGIIGIGSLTLELAFRASKEGYSVTAHNPKGNSLVRETIEKADSIRLGSLFEAAGTDLILLFIAKNDLEQVLSELPDMTGKTVVHTSGLVFDPKSLLAGLRYAVTYPITASVLPNAHVVKLFKPLKLDNTHTSPERDEIFYLSDHALSGLQVKTFLKTLHFNARDLSGRLRLRNAGLSYQSSIMPPAGLS